MRSHSVFLAGLMLLGPVHAADLSCSAKSGPNTAALVELYTSEGCSSCPPADDWMRSLRAGGYGPERVVPLALHVDYWDYIGWKDPLAKPLYTARQRELAAINRKTFVYTPQVLVSGRDYRSWSSNSSFSQDVKRINGQPARADIVLSMRPGADGALEVAATGSVPNAADRAEAALYLTFYQSGLANAVAAGENRGVTLRHDFVARDWAGPASASPGGIAEARLVTRLAAALSQGQFSLAAIIDSFRTVLAGLLLIFPGVISDVMALFLLLLPLREPAYQRAPRATPNGTRIRSDGVIEGEFRRER